MSWNLRRRDLSEQDGVLANIARRYPITNAVQDNTAR